MQAYKTDATFFLLKSLTNVIFKGVTAEDLVEQFQLFWHHLALTLQFEILSQK